MRRPTVQLDMRTPRLLLTMVAALLATGCARGPQSRCHQSRCAPLSQASTCCPRPAALESATPIGQTTPVLVDLDARERPQILVEITTVHLPAGHAAATDLAGEPRLLSSEESERTLTAWRSASDVRLVAMPSVVVFLGEDAFVETGEVLALADTRAGTSGALRIVERDGSPIWIGTRHEIQPGLESTSSRMHLELAATYRALRGTITDRELVKLTPQEVERSMITSHHARFSVVLAPGQHAHVSSGEVFEDDDGRWVQVTVVSAVMF